VRRKVLLRLFLVTTLAGFGFGNSVRGGEAEVKLASFAVRAREIFAAAQKRHLAEPTNAVAAWEFARACFDRAEFATNDTERVIIADQGIAACRRLLERQTGSAPAHYYLGMNLGQLALLLRARFLVDAVSYLRLGHVFVANMTGNVVFLGFAVADAKDFSIPTSLTAIVAFLLGALAGGRLGARVGGHRGRYLTIATYVEIALVGAALIVSPLARDLDGALVRYTLIVLLALVMGFHVTPTSVDR